MKTRPEPAQETLPSVPRRGTRATFYRLVTAGEEFYVQFRNGRLVHHNPHECIDYHRPGITMERALP